MRQLRDFLQQEMAQRRILSNRDFAEFIGVSHMTVNRLLAEETRPELDVLEKIAKATRTDLCALVAMVAPDATLVDPEVQVMVSRIARLSRPAREMVDAAILGFMFKHGNQ